jgi:hypothetical protein
MADIMAAQAWRHNGWLIADVADLGYLRSDLPTVDLTHGNGVFWKIWKPDHLIRCTNGEEPHQAALADVICDFRDTPFADNQFAQTVFDPPWQPSGAKSGANASQTAHYGNAGLGRKQVTALIQDGLTEAFRITAPRGTIITKTGRGVDAGRLYHSGYVMAVQAEKLGLVIVNEFVMLTNPRSQSHRGPQKSPRSNYSTLTIWRKPK